MHRLLFILVLLTALPVHATEVAPDSMLFADYQSMLTQLRANGIEPTQVAWEEVNPLCVGFMNYKDEQTTYNRCLFDKAVLAVSFATDRETCNIESLAVTPDSLRKNKVVIAQYVPGEKNDELTTIETPRISRSELKTARTASYNRCMLGAGWKSPRNWRLGYAK